MIKKIVASIVVLLIVAVAAVVFYLDSLVKSGIEVAGSRVLGTAVTVDSVSLSPLSGSGSISGLRIANPEGYSTPYAFELGEVSLALNLGSLTTDLIEVDSVIIDSPRITYETRISQDNIRDLLGNIDSGGGSTDTPESSGARQEIIIRDFQMLNPQLDLITAVASAPVTMPDIIITDIGTGSNGATTREVLQLIIGRINRAIVEGNIPGVSELRDRARGRLEEIQSEARDAVDDAVQNLGNRLQDILN